MAVDADSTDSELSHAESALEAVDEEEPTEHQHEADHTSETSSQAVRSIWRPAMTVGLSIIVILAILVGWLGYRTFDAHQAEQQRQLFLQAARQGALNLTTVSHSQVDADIGRILDSLTGSFHDEFQQRAQAFADVVKQAGSTSVGTITEAGFESEQGDQAQVLVAVAVKTSDASSPDQASKAWRMRVDVQRVGDLAKVSDVEFVP